MLLLALEDVEFDMGRRAMMPFDVAVRMYEISEDAATAYCMPARGTNVLCRLATLAMRRV